ncbi:MAG: HD domain-containing protein [Oscillospiraceae bacterium]|nr:HD domain-containing protein [Oscillospiraceae bacterium]
MNIPNYVAAVIGALENAGYEAYVVGGCVRDALSGKVPHDYDVATSALPEETKRSMGGLKVVETGIKHGTVTVISEGRQVEVTTYRIDGDYRDGRHPESVSFTRSLEEDLARRDFTVNGMAYGRGVLVDIFGGQDDLKSGVIRCIGAPEKRFSEDALRIMRALRFSAVLGFEIEENTARHAVESRRLLKKVSAERILAELKQLIRGKDAERVLRQFPEIFSEIIPELAPEIGFEQHSRYHDSALYEHSVRAVGAVKEALNGTGAEYDEKTETALGLAMLLHDCGKVHCRSFGEDGEGHYYGHANISAEIADGVLRRLKCSNADRERICGIIKYHDLPIELSGRFLRRQLSKHGELLRDIIVAHIADDMAKREFCRDRIPQYYEALKKVSAIEAEKPCLTVKELAVNGNDLKELLPPSPELGRVLKELLAEVIDGRLENKRIALIKRAAELTERGGFV